MDERELIAHRQWLGYLQPVGLVVSPPALVSAQAIVNSNVAPEHERFLAHIRTVPVGLPEDAPVYEDLRALLTDSGLFNWSESDLVPADDPRCENLEVVLTDPPEVLRPTFAVRDPDNQGWMILIQELPLATDFDKPPAESDTRGWHASAQAKFERLLRDTGVPIGLIGNRTSLRLVYYPRGESPGHVTFPLTAMCEVAGRPVLAALLMLLHADRLFTLPDKQRLPALLAESRKYQNTVSTELAEQVLAALFELLRGFQAADDRAHGNLLRDVLAREPDQVYAGLVTVLMRLVFLLYAEDRGLLSDAEVYVRHYSIGGLFERLREDAGRYPDTMHQRYGAWAQLLALFRLVHDGGGHGDFRLPQRHGHLFEPDRYPFLEGRPVGDRRGPGQKITPPAVPDGVVHAVLENLLMLHGERISYRTLDVEQIGSVYEAIMGYRLEKAAGRSIALKPKKKHGAPVTVNLTALLAVKAADRAKYLKEHADQGIDGKALAALKAADYVEALVSALERRVAKTLTPNIVPPGGMVLQPSDERRRSGSHYTPRALTEPIVRKALEPVLARLGEKPTPAQILDLKVCDPAMGSGAFLVEACRQLAEALVTAWQVHGQPPARPADEDELTHARRLVAQRCLYGVDKNPMAVDLAKLSLWLATLAKDHPFTFLDHALREGDSLVGLTKEQIKGFRWTDKKEDEFVGIVDERVDAALKLRERILDPFTTVQRKEELHREANAALNTVRFVGNLVVAAFFGADSDKKRKALRTTLFGQLNEYLRTKDMRVRPTKAEQELRTGDKPVEPFHWQIEFPEVFQREQPGFDCFVGNPPFLGGTRISEVAGMSYFQWLVVMYPPCEHHCDLVAFFFRRAYSLLRLAGSFGLVATNTIAQGDTREGGLATILENGGTIYNAIRRLRWPGDAAVVVSVVHIAKSRVGLAAEIDSAPVKRISAYLFEGTYDKSPSRLQCSPYFSLGSKIYGQGFLFADDDQECTPLEVRDRILAAHPDWASRILPYLVGEELNGDPEQRPQRSVIFLSDLIDENQLAAWPELREIVEAKVRPERVKLGNNPNNIPLKKKWWAYQAHRPELYAALAGRPRALCISRVGQALAFAFSTTKLVFSEAVVVFDLSEFSAFATLQSRTHEIWARFFASSMKDDLRYTPSDCFETFPFPQGFETDATLEAVGQEYYEFRAALMVRNNEGLTKTYNRFHDPHETSEDILKLRELHAAMDRAVLAAYGPPFSDLVIPPCESLLDYEDDDDEEETTGKRQKKKPWRYRWPDAFRDEVLALLLTLNKERADAEKLSAAKPAKKASAKPRKKKTDTPDLF